MPAYFFSTRAVVDGGFASEPGKPGQTRFLRVPDGAAMTPGHEIPRDLWVNEVQQLALATAIPRPEMGGDRFGDALVFVHGYNSGIDAVLARHRQLQADLAACGWNGVVLSYDWPSANSALNYLEDRADAKATAFALVEDGIRLLATTQRAGCAVAVHLLAHSTGAYVVREAFDHADDRKSLRSDAWATGQCVFIGADISRGSLGESDSSVSLYRHCLRLTNYSNGADEVLQISNYKRLGMAPRAGRVGLPGDAPAAAVNVDCTDYWSRLVEAERRLPLGSFCHSWYFGDLGFTRDLAQTLHGGLDRAALPTRVQIDSSRFALK